MRKTADRKRIGWAAWITVSLCAAVCAVPGAGVYAEEAVTMDAGSSFGDGEAEKLTGTYSIDGDWVLAEDLSTGDQCVYKKSGSETADETSTITCSYLDTNYSVLEYEQLRDMLTNNLLYSNVNAQISASAVYTDAKDYLYILISDDSAEAYRNLYYYVVGDHRCFLLEVQEDRAEAEAMQAADQPTPAEIGQKAAQKFVWNTEEKQ